MESLGTHFSPNDNIKNMFWISVTFKQTRKKKGKRRSGNRKGKNQQEDEKSALLFAAHYCVQAAVNKEIFFLQKFIILFVAVLHWRYYRLITKICDWAEYDNRL